MSTLWTGLIRALLGTFLVLAQAILQVSGTPDTDEARQQSPTPSTTPASISRTAATTCNGRTEYCTRSYSDITFVGSHDAPFVGDLPQQNQYIDIKPQLDMGIRYLQAQTHHSPTDENVLELCHTSCFLEDAGTLESLLVTVKEWLDANANEVVTLLLTNGDSVDVTEFGETFSKSGIDSYAFVPSSSPNTLSIDDWPILGDLVSSGKRMVVFLDYGADTTKVDYILDEFSYYFETPYDVTDPSFSNCSIDRPPGASATGRMYIVNHFLDVDIFGIKVPDRDAAARTNAATGEGSIGAQASECAALYHRAPNVVLADFVDKGDVIEAQDNLNGFFIGSRT